MMLQIRNEKVRQILTSPWPFIALWWLGGLLSIFVPVSKWNQAKGSYYDSYGRWNEYQQKQRQYQEAQNQNQNNYQVQQFNCKWWQSKCREQEYYYYQNLNNNNGNGNGNTFYAPNWYHFLGGRMDQDSADREMMDGSVNSNSGAIKFVYSWSIVMFLAVLAYGTYIFFKRRSVLGLNGLLAVVTQYALLMLILVPQGVISTLDERDMEESIYGWYGQMGVLLVYFNYAQVLFGIIFMILVNIKGVAERKFLESSTNKTDITSDYRESDDALVTPGDKSSMI